MARMRADDSERSSTGALFEAGALDRDGAGPVDSGAEHEPSSTEGDGPRTAVACWAEANMDAAAQSVVRATSVFNLILEG